VSPGELAALVGLGAFHGLNPGMGWLFAVAIGLQERSRAALFAATGPIAAGHLVSMAVVAVAVTVGASATTGQTVSIVGGVALVGVGMWLLLRRRHFRWVGMRLTGLQLATWSFLMASVHGAGLMLVPVLAPGTHAHHGPVADGLLAAVVHTVAMIAVVATIAFCVYQFLGLRILRSAWINLDRIWAVALVGAGSATCVAALV
jgi:multisubunit Na+/H+ antiporter MnhC subunit